MNYPILLDANGKNLAIIDKAYNVVIEDELLTSSNGYETLTFTLSNSDKKRHLLGNERVVEVQGRHYVIRVIEDLKNGSNLCTVMCDAIWYDLNDGELKYLMHYTSEKIDAETAIAQQLIGTDWEIGTVDINETRPKHTAEKVETSLYNLREICGIFGGDLFFDTKHRKVSLLSNMGIRHEKIFCYEKNTTSIKRTIDTRNLFTRYSLIGKDANGNEITVADINEGKDYVENYDWYDQVGLPRKLKYYRHADDRWSDKQNMLDHMNSWIKVYSKPVIGYELSVSLFEVSPNLGDYVYVLDKDLSIGNWLRVVSRKKNVLEPHLSTVQLEAVKKTIVETIVTTSSTSQQVQDIVDSVITPNMEVKLPPGVEDWIMQYKNGKWCASNILGDINSILDALNGEVV